MDIAKLLYIFLGILVGTAYVLVDPSIPDNLYSQNPGVNPVVAQSPNDVINSSLSEYVI